MNNVYLIYGSDYGLVKKEIDKITNGISDINRYDLSTTKIDNLLDDASCISMFEDKKVIIGDNALFLTNTLNNVNHNIDYLLNYLNEKKHNNIIILNVLLDKLDERKKIVKVFKETAKVIHVEPIEPKDLPNYVINEFNNSNYNIDFKTANYFISYVGKNIDIIDNEISKMKLYKSDDNKITINDINNISSKMLNDNVFEFTDAILKKNYNKIFQCYNDLKKLNEDSVKLISILANQFILIYQVKILSDLNKSQSEIASILNIHPYRVKLAYESDFFINELEDMIKQMHKLDYGIKSGNLNKDYAFEDFLLRL